MCHFKILLQPVSSLANIKLYIDVKTSVNVISKLCDYLSGSNNTDTISSVKILHYSFMYKHILQS